MVDITQAMIDRFETNGTTLTFEGVPVEVDQTIDVGDLLVAVAHTGVTIVSISQMGGYDPISGTTKEYNFTVLDGGARAEFVFESGVYIQYFNFVVESAAPFLVGSQLLSLFDLDDITANCNGVPLLPETEIFVGDLLEIFPPEGYVLVNIELYTDYFVIIGNSYMMPFDIVEGGEKGQYTVNPDEDILSVVDTNTPFYYYEKVLEQIAVDVSGSNNVYLVDNDDVSSLNEQRFMLDDDGSGGITKIDYGIYILGLIEIPSSIDPELIANDEQVKLADRQIALTVPTVVTDKIVFDMGEIYTPASNSNLLDFADTTCVLHLPYSNSIIVDSEYVIGQTVSIEYIIDAYSGEATINLTSSAIGEVFHTTQVSLGINIPYASSNTGSVQSENISISVGGDNRILVPFIEIRRNEAILPNGTFTSPIYDEGELNAASGYIVVENIELKGSSNSIDKELIKAYLSGGVIIND